MRVIAQRIAVLSVAIGLPGICANAAPLMWLSIALGFVGLCAFAAALRGAA